MTAAIFYSLSPFGTGDLKVAANISISGGVATLTVAQTGNIGVGCDIEYNSLHAYIAPNRIGFDSGGTTELKPGTKIEDATSGATGIVRYVEVTSGSWAGGDAAGWIYFESTTGTFGDNNQINRTKPTSVSDIATVNGSIQGNIGNGNTEFVVKTATGGIPADQTSVAVTSIHHEWALLADYEAHFTDSSHINNTNLVPSGSPSGEVGGTGDGSTTDFNYTLTYANITTSSLIVHYTIGSTAYTATDDGSGNISGTDCSGTINYDTGAVSLTFTTAPDDSTDITNDYSFTGADVVAFACCYYDHDDQTADTTATTIDFGTTRADNYLQVYTPVGEAESINNQRHSGIWDDSKCKLEVLLTSNEANVYLEGLQIKVSGTPISLNVSDSGNIKISYCLLFQTGTTGNYMGIDATGDGTYTCYIWDTIIVRSTTWTSNYGVHSNASSGVLYGYNVTSTGGGKAYGQEAGTVTLKNCIGYNTGDKDFLGTMTVSYCASEDDTADDNGGEGNKINQDFTSTFVDAPNNLHLSSADTVARDAGADLSSDPNLPIWRDIDGDEIGASWDIGADEYVTSGGQSASLSDIITFSESLTPKANYKASLSDSLNLSETPQAIGQYKRTLLDSLNLTESLSPIGHFLRVLLDGLSMSDALSALAGYKASTSDTLSLSDSTTVIASYKSSLTDTITLTDNFSALLKALASLSDILSLTDSITYPAGQVASLSDTLSLTDSVSAKAALLAAISDVFTLSDTTVALAKLKALLSDTFNLSDEIIAGLSANLIDTLTLSDSANSVGHFLTTLADTMTLTDSASGIIHIQVSLSDTLSFSDQLSALAKYAAAIIDTLNLTDEISGVSISITGELTITFSSSKPTMVFSSSKSTVGLTGSKSTITLP